MLTSVGQSSYPPTGLHQPYIPSVQLPSALPMTMRPMPVDELPPAQLTPPPFAAPTPHPDLLDQIQEEGRRIQPEVTNILDRIRDEAQGFFRWVLAPMHH